MLHVMTKVTSLIDAPTRLVGSVDLTVCVLRSHAVAADPPTPLFMTPENKIMSFQRHFACRAKTTIECGRENKNFNND